MSLTDPEILELNELCNAVIDGTLTDAQKAALSNWLLHSEEARRFYVRVTGLSASLCHYAAELQTGDADGHRDSTGRDTGRRWRWMIGLFAVAASIALFALLIRPTQTVPKDDAVATTALPPEVEYVAQLTGGKDYKWASSTPDIGPRQRLRKGQQIELTSGFAEITFDSGAQVLLQGPALLDVNSAWSATLKQGKLTASLPPEAMGFSISNPTVEVVDIGTEFTMVADAGGAATEVLVLKGEVEAAPRNADEQQPIVLREKEGRRFASSGVSSVHDSDEKFAQLRQPVALDRFVSPIGYAHWSFDEIAGNVFKADSFDLPFTTPAAEVELGSGDSGAIHGKGHAHGALRFDGNVFAKTAFPGLSGNEPYTICFWVKVPREASLSNAYAMVAWGASDPRFGSHPFHIAWNRKSDEGPMGVLRTDYGRGYALGSTPLRDGKWHHIAVVFIPRENADSPVEVKQYVDGRLEGEGRPSAPGSDIFDNGSKPSSGAIWLGCRLGPHGVRVDRFLGEMDELFIANRALQPHEIVRLMTTNSVDE